MSCWAGLLQPESAPDKRSWARVRAIAVQTSHPTTVPDSRIIETVCAISSHTSHPSTESGLTFISWQSAEATRTPAESPEQEDEQQYS